MIKVKGIYFTYADGTQALNGVNITVLEGESIAIIGKNGAGKSTLILHLNGIFTPTKGTIHFQGEEVEKETVSKIRSNIGLVFQDPDDQLFMPTIEEDVAFGPKNMGLPTEEVAERVKNALSMVGLQGFEKRSSHHLSFGEKKKAAIATILSMNPEVLALDEPTLGLDPWAKKDFTRLLQELMEDHTTILATHDLELAGLCDRVLLMEAGKIREIPDKEIKT